jgi:hypothetical protein
LVESVTRSALFIFFMALRILVLGSGGREHALVWKLSQSFLVERIFVCPGNGGTNQVPKAKNVSMAKNTFEELVTFAIEEKVLQSTQTPSTATYMSFRSPSFFQDQNNLLLMA